MSECCKETMCTTCIHQDICSLKEKFLDAQKAVNYGVVHGALAMTTPGDTSMASLKEVEAKVNGAGARVQR